MSSRNLLILLLGAFLSGCAIHGTVVSKSFTPLPFSYSLGVDGIFRFELRDGDRVFSQMVPPEVFFSYAVGDEFDDRFSLEEGRRRNWQRHGEEKDSGPNAETDQEKKISLTDHHPVRLLRQRDRLPEQEGF